MIGLEGIGGASIAQGLGAYGGSAGGAKADPDGLTDEERQQIQELKQRDQEVRAHERAHQSAAGSYGGGASYTFTRGPDGRQYAVGGEVQIDASPVSGNPKATIAKMETVIRAALAPAQPSAQDHKVAAQAQAAKAKAQIELQQKKDEEEGGDNGGASDASPVAQAARDAYEIVADALTRGASGIVNLVA